jgi:hypothetical protein
LWGRICLVQVAPQGRPWMWASARNSELRRAAHGYEATREAAMAAFAKAGEGNAKSYTCDARHTRLLGHCLSSAFAKRMAARTDGRHWRPEVVL